MQKYSVDFFDQRRQGEISWGILIIFPSVKDRLICLVEMFFALSYTRQEVSPKMHTEILLLQGV